MIKSYIFKNNYNLQLVGSFAHDPVISTFNVAVGDVNVYN